MGQVNPHGIPLSPAKLHPPPPPPPRPLLLTSDPNQQKQITKKTWHCSPVVWESLCAVCACSKSRADNAKLSSVIRTISPLGRGTPKQLVGDRFLFNSWKHSTSLVVHLHAVFFFMRSVRGTDEWMKLWIWAKAKVHIVADVQNFALRAHCMKGILSPPRISCFVEYLRWRHPNVSN